MIPQPPQQLVELHLVIEDDSRPHATSTDYNEMIARAQWLALIHAGKWVAVRSDPIDPQSTVYAVQLVETINRRIRN
jgi:hypothetical protein